MAKSLRQSHPPRRNPAESLQRLDIYCIGQLEVLLCLTRHEIRDAAKTAPSQYHPHVLIKEPLPFAKKKPLPKKRDLDNPSKALQRVQKRIYHKLLKPLRLPNHIKGGVPSQSIVHNLEFHKNAGTLVTIDIRKWFPSITANHVFYVWHDVLGCSRRMAALLTCLTTVNGHLPQGTSTSTAIANLVLFSIDAQIRIAARRKGVRYSSWVDDLTFSGKKARELIPIVASTLKRNGFRVARNKLRVMGSGKKKEVNGLLIGSRPSLPKELLDRIRSGLYHLERGDVPDWKVDKYKLSLRGRITYARSIDYTKGDKLRAKLDSLS